VETVVGLGITVLALLIFALVFVGVVYVFGKPPSVTKAVRYAVTLRNNEGAFVALCTQKRWDHWTFVDVKITPTNPGGAYAAAAPGELYVPRRNILYYQQIVETANVA